MKKVFLLFMGLIILTGCNKKEEQIDNLSVYEYHYYNEMAKSSNNYVAKYDEKGNFMSLEITTIFDERSVCPNEFFKAEKYFNKGIENMKNENIKEDEQNYIIIKNKRIHW